MPTRSAATPSAILENPESSRSAGIEINLHRLQDNVIALVQSPLLILIIGVFTVGFAPVFVRLVQDEVDPGASAFWRLGTAFPILWLIVFLQERKSRATGREETVRSQFQDIRLSDLVKLAFSGICFTAVLVSWHWSIHFTSIANATLFVNMVSIFTALGAILFFKSRFTPIFFFGLGLSLSGVFVVIHPNAQFSETSLIGDMLSMGSAIFYASFLILCDDLSRRFSTALIMAANTTVSAFLALPFVISTGVSFFPRTLTSWLLLFGLGIVCQVAGRSFIQHGLARLTAAYASVTLLLHPVAAALLAWLFFSEALSLYQLIGGCIILSGILVVQREQKAQSEK